MLVKMSLDKGLYQLLCLHHRHTPHSLLLNRAINHFCSNTPTILTLASMDTWVHEYTGFVSTTLFLKSFL